MLTGADRLERAALGGILGRALALGSLAAVVQLLFVYRKVHVHGTFAWASRDVYWSAPLANAAILAGVGALLWLGGRLVPRLGSNGVVDAILGSLAALTALLVLGGLAEWAVVLLAVGVGIQYARLRTVARGRWHALASWSGWGVAALLAAGGVGERLTRDRRATVDATASAEGPNVLLIIWDTVRAANLSLYGYERPTTPELAAMARDATTWEWAMAPAPWTLPSHCSMFTGLHPGEHSCRWDDPLKGAPATVAEVASRRGWRTGAFMANLFYTTHESGLQRGFETWEDFRLSPRQVLLSSPLMQTAIARDLLTGQGLAGRTRALRAFKLRGDPKPLNDRKLATQVTDEFLAWQARDARPFFAVLNLFDAHDPYDPPAPWSRRFGDAPDRVALYDGGIAYMDAELGRLLRTLASRGVLDRTIVVVTSDHGEMFGEHGIENHGHALYLPLLHVPLVIRAPGRLPAGGRAPATVGLRDLPATLLDLMAVREATGIEGRSFVATAAGADSTRTGSLVLAETERSKLFWLNGPAREGAMHTLLDDSLQYIRDGKGREELYRYREDTAQVHNLVARDSARAAWFRERLGTVSRQLVR